MYFLAERVSAKDNVGEGECRVVSRFLSRRFHPKSRRLFQFYFSSIMLRTDLLTFGVIGAVFKIAGEMRRLPAYFDNPVNEKLISVTAVAQTPHKNNFFKPIFGYARCKVKRDMWSITADLHAPFL